MRPRERLYWCDVDFSGFFVSFQKGQFDQVKEFNVGAKYTKKELRKNHSKSYQRSRTRKVKWLIAYWLTFHHQNDYLIVMGGCLSCKDTCNSECKSQFLVSTEQLRVFASGWPKKVRIQSTPTKVIDYANQIDGIPDRVCLISLFDLQRICLDFY